MTTVSRLRLVAEKLDDLLLQYSQGDALDPVVQLRSELDRIRHQLEAEEDELKVNENNTGNKISGEAKRQLEWLSNDIENAVESYARRQDEAAAKANSSGCKSSLIVCLSTHKWSLSTDILLRDVSVFKRRIDDLRLLPVGSTERQIDAAAGGGTGQRSSNSAVEPPPDHDQVSHSRRGTARLVGINADLDRLTSLLIEEEHKSLSVIAVCGDGGLGKTTVARLFYNSRAVLNHFHSRAWATVGMEFDGRDILESLLSSLASSPRSKDEIARMEMMQLVKELYKVHKEGRYLIVLDDVWSLEAWDALRIAFPDDANGSNIIITTQRQDLARRLTTSVHEMRPLDEASGWSLLRMRSGQEKLELPDNLNREKVGKEITKCCGGSPVALSIVGSSLSGKNLEDWEVMLGRLKGCVTANENLYSPEGIFGCIYNYLPFHLKPCFLYLGHFPQYQAISVEKLYLLWMAEGLIPARAPNDKTQMEVAQGYLNELIARSLVTEDEDEEISASASFKSCGVDKRLRDFCISKGKQEEFFEVIEFGLGNQISPLTFRLAVYLNKFKGTNGAFPNIPKAKLIRSILFFDQYGYRSKLTWPKEVSDLKEFESTRVLDFDGVDFRVRMLPRGIETLIYLRHLGFGGCYLLELPSTFSNFPFLETLDLRVRASCILAIPNVLRKLLKLRHLYFPLAFRSATRDRLKLNTLKKLQVLENFHASICDAEDLLHLENLQVLTGIIDGNNADTKKAISCANTNKSLRHSSLVVKNFDCFSNKRCSIVADLLQCKALYALELEGCLGVFPRCDQGIGSNFTRMIFDGSEFSEDPMPILGKLPNLRSLVLCNDAFAGTEMACSDPEDFPQLTSLKLASLQFLEAWEVEEGAMPYLKTLTIEKCDKLEMMSWDVNFLKLMVGLMPKVFQDMVNKMIEYRRDRGYKELTVTYYDN